MNSEATNSGFITISNLNTEKYTGQKKSNSDTLHAVLSYGIQYGRISKQALQEKKHTKFSRIRTFLTT